LKHTRNHLKKKKSTVNVPDQSKPLPLGKRKKKEPSHRWVGLILRSSLDRGPVKEKNIEGAEKRVSPRKMY